MKKRYIFLRLLVVAIAMMLLGNSVSHVNAESVTYIYDSLGRVKTAEYSDGSVVIYTYDKNGNIKEMAKKNPEDSEGDSNTTESATDITGVTPMMESIKAQIEAYMLEAIDNNVSVIRPTAQDIKEYNQFKKRKPVIKSLKHTKKKGKRYLTIQIRELAKIRNQQEMGYQIKYATNKRFKKAKTVDVIHNKQKTLTMKKWKIAKKKTYYVKVRAYMKTKTGKMIYTKYSKIKSIEVK